MGNIINHGILDINYSELMSIIGTSEHIKSSVYDRPDYLKTRKDEQKDITEKCSKWYKHSSYSYKIKNDLFNKFFDKNFFERFNMKDDPIDISVFKFEPGQFTPPHVDNMGASLDKLQTTKEKVKKLWVAVSPPDFGHAFFVGDQVVYNVPQGTIIETDFISDWHSGVNAGITDRYILTIMGVKNGG
tara:strand:+ start:924 stop:1484 length:561 start_codon:yes stop_codon:yes gene_type:complete